MKLNTTPPSSCLNCGWRDSPTPSGDKNFDWNLDPQQQKYEDLQDQTQQKLLELEGEINWYHQQKTLLESKLAEFQDNEEQLWETINYLQDQLEQKEQDYSAWQTELQERLNSCCQTELKLEELLNRYKKGKTSWEQRANSLGKELNRQSQANRKKKKKLKRTSFRLKVAKQEKQNLQDWKDNHVCSCSESCCVNNDYDTIKTERDTYQTQLGAKDQKIAELEHQLKEKDRIIEELRNKPPIQPLNNPVNSENDNPPQQEPNRILINKERLLNTIQQQKETIQLLQKQLSQTNSPEPQIIVKEVPVENLTTINQLQAQLKDKKRTLIWLNCLLLISVGISVLLVLNRYLFKKSSKKKFLLCKNHKS